MTDDKMRAAFEAWFCVDGDYEPIWLEFHRNGFYTNHDTENMWQAWQAATRAAVPAWQPIETAPTDGTIFLAYRRGVVAMARRIPRDDCEMWHFGTENAAEEYWPGTRPSHWTPMPAAPEAP